MALPLIIGAIGVGLSAIGLGMSYSASRQQAEAARQKAIIDAKIAAGQVRVNDAQQRYANIQFDQQQLQLSTNRKVIALQQQQEELRRTGMNLDARRRIREAYRSSRVARATSLAIATNQGAGAGTGSSASAGAMASASARGTTNAQGIRQQQALGGQMFDTNKLISQTYLEGSDLNSQFVEAARAAQLDTFAAQREVLALGGQAAYQNANYAMAGGLGATGSALSSVGGGLVNNLERFDRLGTYFGGGSGLGSSSGYSTFSGDAQTSMTSAMDL